MWWIIFTFFSAACGFVCTYDSTSYSYPSASDTIVWNRVSARYVNCTSLAYYHEPRPIQFEITCLENPVLAGFTAVHNTITITYNDTLATLRHSPPGVYQFVGTYPIAHLYTACLWWRRGYPRLIHPLQRMLLTQKDNKEEKEDTNEEEEDHQYKKKDIRHNMYSRIPYHYPLKRIIGPRGM